MHSFPTNFPRKYTCAVKSRLFCDLSLLYSFKRRTHVFILNKKETTGPPTTARRLSYPGQRLAWGLSGRPGGPADRQTDTQTEKQTGRQKVGEILLSLAFLGKTLLLPNKE